MGSELKKITQKELMERYIRTTRLHLEALEECDKNNVFKPELTFNFSGLDLSRLIFHNMNIPNARFDGSNLRDAYFSSCTMTYSTFTDANMERSTFQSCNLLGSEFYCANMKHMDVLGSNFDSCIFSRADMLDMRYVDNANFDGADLENAFNPPMLRMACPAVGSFYGYKKCFGNKIVTLLIPEDAKRSSATGIKCRCDKAKVISIESYYGSIKYQTAIACHDHGFVYRVGEFVTSEFCGNRYYECAPGIHFFLNKQDAINY